ncbi:hypothetical protein H8S90_10520 [Olivibacter sp. SDN3]|uniref:hypothetical protein n=1 Tax=Olivibacter sp. SDN3 TaxID=2764720 RepID=UPI0016515C2A|nr:hypothetical protein [Olivibacter sp. SDN3]QNL51967.1 hypothetical protein H8S90_10520 [Olivibacter sp. SDN3]
MKKVYITILTLVVLGTGYVGAKAFDKKVEVRQETRWFESADGSDQNYNSEPLPTSFEPADCTPAESTCAARFEVNDDNEAIGTPIQIQPGVLL